MSDQTILKIKAELDAALIGVRPMMGILFNDSLFDEFRRRGWITLEKFNLEDFGFHDPMPAYNKTHFASATWGLKNNEYRIGRDA